MCRLGIGFVASILLACSDDGVPADSDSQTQADDDGTGDDGSGTAPTATATDPDTATVTDPTGETQTDSADGTGSSDGTSQSTGDGTSSGDTGPGPGDACMTEADCVVVDDCCNCLAIPADQEPPECDIEACLQSTCMAQGVPPVAACELGSCELAPVPCDPSVVSCESLPPECPEGFVPGVNPETSCWTGACVPVESCDVVPACADCPDDEACVEYVTQLGPQYHCAPVPESCDGTPSCACMAEACVAPFDTCGEGDMGISCSCPVCG